MLTQAAVSIGVSEVLVLGLSFGKSTTFCLLASGPQRFISCFESQTRGYASERSEEMRECPALGDIK